MHKRAILAAVASLAVFAIAWSMATLGGPKIAGNKQPTEASAPISPRDITVQQGSTLPVEYWAHPF